MSAVGEHRGVAAASVVLASRNRHKLVELSRILAAAPAVATLAVRGVEEFPGVPEVAETGVTFAENALLKAEAVARATGLTAIADDSGLAVDALGGSPGVFSARWAGRHGDDGANLRLLLAQLSDLPDEHRGARFVCAAVAVTPDGRQRVAHGELRGSLTRAPVGENGFGYDPIFLPEGGERTTAQLSAAEKDAISHRGIALRALAPLLGELLVTGR